MKSRGEELEFHSVRWISAFGKGARVDDLRAAGARSRGVAPTPRVELQPCAVFVQRPVGRVRVAGNKVDRQAFARQKSRNCSSQTGCQSSASRSSASRDDGVAGDVLGLAVEAGVGHEVAGGRAADAQRRVDLFHRQRRHAVQLEILALRPAEERVQVRLVPDLEVPAPHFLDPVALDPVAHRAADQFGPLGVVLGRRAVALPPEDRALFARQIAGAEAELDERADADLQQPVEERVHVLEVVDRLPRLLAVDEHVVVEQAVEADVAEAALGGGRAVAPASRRAAPRWPGPRRRTRSRNAPAASPAPAHPPQSLSRDYLSSFVRQLDDARGEVAAGRQHELTRVQSRPCPRRRRTRP